MNDKCKAENCIKTGFNELDELIGGFKPGELILISGRPTVGKTTYAMNMLDQACRKDGKKAIVFSLDLSEEQLRRKYLELQSEDGGVKSEKGFIVDDTPLITVGKINQRVESAGPISLILIDYLQLMSADGEYINRASETEAILQGLKELSLTYRIPVVVLGQLGRECEVRSDHRPRISDLKDSNSAEDIVDVILFLFRDGYNSIQETGESGEEAEIIVAKHPEINQTPVTVSLMFDFNSGFYENVTDE